MLTKKLTLIIVFIGFLFSCHEAIEPYEKIKIIPAPFSYSTQPGHFILDNNTSIQFDERFAVSAQFLKAYIKNGSPIELNSSSTKQIVFSKDESQIDTEAYALSISPKTIEIKAKTDQGAFYAVQTLRQLLPSEFENGSYNKKEVILNSISIEDVPQFKYRGMHLDVGRHMFSVAFIKKYIDALALLKMNTFHWHLTEDQGWRIEIKKYPKLNEIAAFRDETLVGHYSDQPHQFDGKQYGGFYTQEQIKEIVSYALKNHITIIPEIEMPGHAQAALAAYPELSCNGEPIKVATKWGVFEEIFCTKDETFNFLEDVLDEVMALFPDEYIHIGGDEAPKTRWKTCDDCQHRISEEGLKDEHELQNYFITRIEKYLNSKGRQIIGWDEILEGGLAPNATVMSWRGINGAIEAAKQNHNVVMTPTSHCYFDYYQSENQNEPLAIGGFLPLEKVYSFNPIPDELNEREAQFVLGAQGNIWTEYISTEQQLEYMAFPRMIAMSEVVWSHEDKKEYKNFVVRLENFHNRLDALNINYANHLYEIHGDLNTQDGKITYQLGTLTEGKDIRFTLDGSDPKIDSELYADPFQVQSNRSIKAAVFNSESRIGSIFDEDLNFHKAVGKNVVLNVEPHESYNEGGKAALINSIMGSDSRYGDKEWLGFWGDDLEITIDFEEEIEINSISTRFHNGNGQWIYAPKKIIVYFDDVEFETYDLGPFEELLVNWKQLFNEKTARSITLKIPNYGLIPEGRQGAGNKAWTFIDEIIVN